MGQGGQFRLVNNTSRTWTRTKHKVDNMNSWNLPEVVQPGQALNCYIEFPWSSLGIHPDTEYTLSGDGSYRFSVYGESGRSHNIAISNFNMPASEWGDQPRLVSLGWHHDGFTTLVLPTRRVESWMSTLPGNINVTDLNIPGTHDSGTYKMSDMYLFARCQQYSIIEQLQAGIRFLDVRCRHIGNKFAIHHGEVYGELNFDDILKACTSFLDKNPSEAILMSVKEEYTPTGCTRSFGETFDEYAGDKKYASYWYTENRFPDLKDARKKIILIRRFPSSKGIDWDDAGQVQYQDNYAPNSPYVDTKWKSITDHLEKAVKAARSTPRPGDPKTLFMNFASAYATPALTPFRFASAINPRLSDDLRGRGGRYGLVIQDFFTDDVSRSIIHSNPPRVS